MTVEVIKHELFFNEHFRKQGMIKASFQDLVEAFGEPSHCGEFLDYSVQAEWLLELCDNEQDEHVIIYDYYVSSNPVNNTDWTVSGHCPKALELVEQALEEVK